MAKSRNNLLGVGGQRKKLSRAPGQSTGSNTKDRTSAAEQKQELLRRMREHAARRPAASAEPASAEPASAEPDSTEPDSGSGDRGQPGNE